METTTETQKEADRSAPACSASYRGYIHVLQGGIWEEQETLDLAKNDSLVDAFTVAMAKCQGISKRSGLQARVMFVCEPNGAALDPVRGGESEESTNQ